MPEYSVADIEHIIDVDEFKALYNKAFIPRDRMWITTLWFTGARPSELIKELRKKDIIIEDNQISFHIVTKKLKKEGKFQVAKRMLVLNINSESRYSKFIKSYLRRFRDAESIIFNFDRKTGNNIITRIVYDTLGIALCPYNFRHTRMTLLAERGVSEETLMQFKGARSRHSVRPYLHARKIEYSVEIDFEDDLKE